MSDRLTTLAEVRAWAEAKKAEVLKQLPTTDERTAFTVRGADTVLSKLLARLSEAPATATATNIVGGLPVPTDGVMHATSVDGTPCALRLRGSETPPRVDLTEMDMDAICLDAPRKVAVYRAVVKPLTETPDHTALVARLAELRDTIRRRWPHDAEVISSAIRALGGEV